jgi:hypothetical protein
MVWRSRATGNDQLYVLLEFQSTVERLMALRVLTYVGLLYQDLEKAGRLSRRQLPSILPIVLYCGDRKWNAPTSLRALSRTRVSFPNRFRPQMRYHLIDVRRLRLNAPCVKSNLAAALFRIENSRTRRELGHNVRLLHAILRQSGTPSLRRAFAVWINRVVLVRWKRGPVKQIINFEEKRNVLEDMLKREAIQMKATARRAGRREGLREGLREGKAMLVLGQLRARFGRELPGWAQRRVHRATNAQLTRWAKRLLAVESLDELFRRGRTSATAKTRVRTRAAAAER